MTKGSIYRATLIPIFILYFSLPLLAQETTTVRATADRNRILIGEPLRISLEADIPENEPIRFFSIDTIAHFEFLSREKIDTTNTGTGTVLKQIVYVTSFDSGHWVIPQLALGEGLLTDSIPVDVVFSEFNPQQPYHDVKDIIEVKPEEKKKETWWWYAAGGGLLLILLLYLLFRKKKKPAVVVAAPPIDPYKEAIDALQKLVQQKPETKTYYSLMVDTFRIYIARKKGIHSLQNTTDDLVAQLKGINMDKMQFDSLAQALRLSDFVKFAKFVPTVDDDVKTLDAVRAAIQYIEQMK